MFRFLDRNVASRELNRGFRQPPLCVQNQAWLRRSDRCLRKSERKVHKTQRCVLKSQRSVLGSKRYFARTQLPGFASLRCVFKSQAWLRRSDRCLRKSERWDYKSQRCVLKSQHSVLGSKRSAVGSKRSVVGSKRCFARTQLPGFASLRCPFKTQTWLRKPDRCVRKTEHRRFGSKGVVGNRNSWGDRRFSPPSTRCRRGQTLKAPAHGRCCAVAFGA
jgi:hypothetical protein